MNSTKKNLLSWDEISQKVDNKDELNPIDQFLYANTPAGEEEHVFREQFFDALNYEEIESSSFNFMSIGFTDLLKEIRQRLLDAVNSNDWWVVKSQINKIDNSIYSNKESVTEGKKLSESFVKRLLKEYSNGEISFGKFVECLNEQNNTPIAVNLLLLLQSWLDYISGINISAPIEKTEKIIVTLKNVSSSVCPRCGSNKIAESDENKDWMDCEWCSLRWAKSMLTT